MSTPSTPNQPIRSSQPPALSRGLQQEFLAALTTERESNENYNPTHLHFQPKSIETPPRLQRNVEFSPINFR